MSVGIQLHASTRSGDGRARNEDQYLIADLRRALKIERTSLAIENDSWLLGSSDRRLIVIADGVWRAVAEKQIGDTLRTAKSAEDAATKLVDASRGSGNPDDATAVVMSVGTAAREESVDENAVESRAAEEMACGEAIAHPYERNAHGDTA